MKRLSAMFVCIAILLSLTACTDNEIFVEGENNTVISKDGTEYILVDGTFGAYCLGDREFIGHVKGEKKSFFYQFYKITTGMYSVDSSRDVLVRYLPHNEFEAIYVRAELLNKEVSIDNCIRFEYVKSLYFGDNSISSTNKSINDCETFLNDIRNSQRAIDAGLYDLVKQPDGLLKNCYTYGYICGVLQDDLNLVIPLEVRSFDDKAYSIYLDGVEYVLPEEWLDKFID